MYLFLKQRSFRDIYLFSKKKYLLVEKEGIEHISQELSNYFEKHPCY